MPEHFDAERILSLPGKTKDDVDRINRKLRARVNVLEERLDKQKNIRYWDINSVMNVLRGGSDTTDFFSFMEHRAGELNRDGKVNYADMMLRTLNHLCF